MLLTLIVTATTLVLPMAVLSGRRGFLATSPSLDTPMLIRRLSRRVVVERAIGECIKLILPHRHICSLTLFEFTHSSTLSGDTAVCTNLTNGCQGRCR